MFLYFLIFDVVDWLILIGGLCNWACYDILS